MSQAFVKESDEQWLHEISPTLQALIVYLTKENNGIRVYERRNYMPPSSSRLAYEMSNGLSYTHDNEGKWMVL